MLVWGGVFMADEISDDMYGVISMAVYGSEYTAVVKDVSSVEVTDYRPVSEGSMDRYVFKPYRLTVELVQAIDGQVPDNFDLITIALKSKPMELKQEPYVISFCRTAGGQYFVPGPLSRFEATAGVIAAVKEMSEDKKLNPPEGGCVANNKFYVPLN